jgi:hypothetical protein
MSLNAIFYNLTSESDYFYIYIYIYIYINGGKWLVIDRDTTIKNFKLNGGKPGMRRAKKWVMPLGKLLDRSHYVYYELDKLTSKSMLLEKF